jgi:hypothetical protein
MPRAVVEQVRMAGVGGSLSRARPGSPRTRRVSHPLMNANRPSAILPDPRTGGGGVPHADVITGQALPWCMFRAESRPGAT